MPLSSFVQFDHDLEKLLCSCTIKIKRQILKQGKIEEYTELDVTYHPRITKTKKINKQKDLKIIRDKFNDDITKAL